MYNSDTELLFPFRVAPTLESIRGEEWAGLVRQVISENATLLDQLAFVLTVVQLAGCISCSADSFRAIRGCSHCSTQAVRRFRGTDGELKKWFNKSKVKVKEYIRKMEFEQESSTLKNHFSNH